MDPKKPIDPARFPFFYGWWIVAVGTVGVVCSIPGQTMGVSVFTGSLLEATGLSRLAISNAYLAGTLASGLLLPFGGTLLDRWGARRTALAACLGLGATLVFLGQIDRVSSWVAPGNVVIGTALLVLGFFGLRFSGQGMLTMVSRTMIGRWFQRRRGLAAGVSGLFVSFGFGSAPLVFDQWIAAAGWRGAWQQMAVIIAVGMGALAWLFYRDRPEQVGLTMDGEGPVEVAANIPEEPSATRAEAMRTLGFWAIVAALSFQALIITGITFHIVDLGAKVGLQRDEAVAIFIPIAFVSTAAGLIGGWLADKASVRVLVAVMMGAQAMGVFAATDMAAYMPLMVIGLGISGGLFSPLSTVAFPRLFGRAHLGAIAGVEMMFIVLGSAVGPSLLAVSESMTGGYTQALLAALALPAFATLLALGVKPVRVQSRA